MFYAKWFVFQYIQFVSVYEFLLLTETKCQKQFQCDIFNYGTLSPCKEDYSYSEYFFLLKVAYFFIKQTIIHLQFSNNQLIHKYGEYSFISKYYNLLLITS